MESIPSTWGLSPPSKEAREPSGLRAWKRQGSRLKQLCSKPKRVAAFTPVSPGLQGRLLRVFLVVTDVYDLFLARVLVAS